jgi:hypothetical protein
MRQLTAILLDSDTSVTTLRNKMPCMTDSGRVYYHIHSKPDVHALEQEVPPLR